MIVKFFRHGKGGAEGVISYLLGKNNDREHALVLQGDVELTRLLIDSSPYENKYKSGVLSFEELARALPKKKVKDVEDFYEISKEERVINEQEKKEIMQKFEETIFVGLEPDQYNILWIEHSDKSGRLELNFVIPCRELRTGKSFNPYYHATDEIRVNAFKNVVNYDYKLTDPNSPSKKRLVATHVDNAPRASAKDRRNGNIKYDDVLQEINQKMMALVQENKLKNREDTLRYLESLEVFGERLEIKRKNGAKSISVKHPLCEKNHRLKGDIYEKGFRYEKKSHLSRFNMLRKIEKTQREVDQMDYDESCGMRYVKDKSTLQEYMERRKVYVEGRYKVSVPEPVVFERKESMNQTLEQKRYIRNLCTNP